MVNFWQWLKLICLIYPLAAVLNSATGLSSALLPWWLWAAAFAAAFGGNQFFLRGRRNMLSLIIFNMVLATVFGILPVALNQVRASSAGWYPGALPGMIEMAFLWPIIVIMVLKPLSARDRVRFLEIGLCTGALLLLAKQYFQIEIPYFWVFLGGFVFAGLLNEAFAHEREKKPCVSSLSAGFPLLLCALLLGLGLFVGWIVATDSMTNLLEKAMRSFAVFMGLLGQFISKIGLDQEVGPTQVLPKWMGAQPFVPNSSFGDTAPLWLMIILWIILGVLLILLLILAVSGLIGIIRKLILTQPALPSYQKGAFVFRFQWKTLIAQSKRILQHCWGLIKRLCLNCFRPPRGVYDAYYFFLRWGKRNGLGRSLGETPQEYYERLLPLLQERSPHLAEPLADLTAAYYLERYREEHQPFPEEKIKFILRSLRAGQASLRSRGKGTSTAG